MTDAGEMQPSFNLVIESLLISRKRVLDRGVDPNQRFNLVIESLLISSEDFFFGELPEMNVSIS